MRGVCEAMELSPHPLDSMHPGMPTRAESQPGCPKDSMKTSDAVPIGEEGTPSARSPNATRRSFSRKETLQPGGTAAFPQHPSRLEQFAMPEACGNRQEPESAVLCCDSSLRWWPVK